MINNNRTYILGKVAKKPAFSHEICGEGFYLFYIEVLRKSGSTDTLPVIVSERLISINRLDVDRTVVIDGQIRSYNKHTDNEEHSHLILSVFAKEIDVLEDVEINPDVDNAVEIVGRLCKPPIYRKTPLGREITDVLIAVNRAYGKSDYIPCITWGRTAKFVGHLPVGTHIEMTGRFQSRPYAKKISEDEVENRVAYEVSVGRVEIIEKKENADE